MIKAKKNKFSFNLFHLYVSYWLCKRSFSSIHVHYEGDYDLKKPLLLLANHSSWWDGMIALFLSKRFIKHDEYVMMNEIGLKQFPFFSHVGAYSVQPQKPKDVLTSLTYTVSLLQQGKAVWLFPQGKEMPLEKRPLDFMSGVSWLAEKVPINTQIAPVTFYYTFMNEQRPRLYIHLGNPISNLVVNETREETRVKIEAIVSKQLDQQRFNIINGLTSAYQVSMYGTKSVSDWFLFFSKKKERR